jgi:DNA mismatch repair protein MutS
VAVKEWNDEIIFMRQVTSGASERSFGIQVARLAGLPDEVVGRAKAILSGLEKGDRESSPPEEPDHSADGVKPSPPLPDAGPLDDPEPKAKRKPRDRPDPSQLELF